MLVIFRRLFRIEAGDWQAEGLRAGGRRSGASGQEHSTVPTS